MRVGISYTNPFMSFFLSFLYSCIKPCLLVKRGGYGKKIGIFIQPPLPVAVRLTGDINPTALRKAKVILKLRNEQARNGTHAAAYHCGNKFSRITYAEIFFGIFAHAVTRFFYPKGSWAVVMRAGIANAVFNKGMGLIIMRLHTVEPKLQYPHAREAGAGKQRLYLIRNIAQILRDKFGVYAPLNGVHKRMAGPFTQRPLRAVLSPKGTA